MQTIIDGVLANYEVVGNSKAKQTILFIHGWGRNLNDWTNIASNLSKDNKIILLDLPGFGGSSIPESTFDTYDYAQFLELFIKKLKLNNLIIVGHSFGGKISTIVASHTDLIKKLFLVDISGAEVKPFSSKIKILLSKIVKPFMSFLPRSLRQLVFEKLASEDYKNAGELKESFKKIVAQNIEKDAVKITIPTIIIWGDKDKEVSVASAKKLKKLIKTSQIRIVWNTGHDPHLEKQQKFLEIIKENI